MVSKGDHFFQNLLRHTTKVGAMFGMLARYAALSFGFKSSNPRNTDYVQLELDLVAGGVAKQILKKVVSLADHAYNIGKSVILKYAKNNHLSWVEDDSNMNKKFRRNFLRLTIIPKLEAFVA
jgi:hypothetical protein